MHLPSMQAIAFIRLACLVTTPYRAPPPVVTVTKVVFWSEGDTVSKQWLIGTRRNCRRRNIYT